MSAGRLIRGVLLTSLAAVSAAAAAVTGCAAPPDARPAAAPAAAAAAAPAGALSVAPAAATPVPAAAQAATPAPAANAIAARPPARLTADQLAELAGLVAELRTSQGTVVLDFLPDKAPGTVANFVELARRGFYDGTTFHRVIPGMFIQGGDPTGTGDGGPGYFIRAEFNDELHVRGTVSMARLRHPDSAGSQFFICLAPLPYLDGGYTAFGRVLSGDEALERIEKLGRATPQGTPTETITLEKVLIRPRSPAERPTASRQP